MDDKLTKEEGLEYRLLMSEVKRLEATAEVLQMQFNVVAAELEKAKAAHKEFHTAICVAYGIKDKDQFNPATLEITRTATPT